MLRLAPFAVLLASLLAVFPAHGLRAGPLSPNSNSALAETSTIAGDVNCSGGVDIVDAVQIIRLYAGLSTSASCMGAAGNTDCDGDKDPVDSLRILRYAAGISNTVPPGCTPIGDPLGKPTSSFDKIDAALTAGTIDSETALTYKVYAVFRDDRLPGQYQGDDSGPVDSFILSDVQAQFDSLSPEAQAILRPFLMPPAYQGSWLSPQSSALVQAVDPKPVCDELDPNWAWVDGATTNVRVWWQTRYPEDQAKANSLAAAMDSTIWPTLTNLMREPLSDAGESCSGGNGRLDIYLALEGAFSLTYSYGCYHSPAYIELNRVAGDLLDLSHEFMHAIQWSYDVQNGCVDNNGEYYWLMEATATWAEDYVYPDNNGEHRFAGSFLSAAGKPLETYGGQHEYGAYLFFQYLTRFYGSDQIIRTIWNNTAQYGSLEAVEQAMPGGFEERWPQFAACLWNTPPSECFVQWDQLAEGVADSVAPRDVDMGAATVSRSLELNAGVEHMATSYQRFTFTDDRIHSVAFKNTLVGYPHAAVQALVKINGEWQGPSDWTEKATTAFCLDVAAQHIEELVIIISNSNWETRGKLQPASPATLTVATGCSSVTLSWDANVADVLLQLWVLPESASNLDEARNQEGQPGYDTNIQQDVCFVPKAERSTAIGGVTEDAQYIAVYWWGWCSDRNPSPPPVVPFTITIQYADGRVDTENAEIVYAGDYDTIAFVLFGPYDFTPPG